MINGPMPTSFRIVDLRLSAEEPKELVISQARTPEEAALLATGEKLVRSGHRDDLCVRVYFQNDGQPLSMVRLYRRIEDRM